MSAAVQIDDLLELVLGLPCLRTSLEATSLEFTPPGLLTSGPTSPTRQRVRAFCDAPNARTRWRVGLVERRVEWAFALK